MRASDKPDRDAIHSEQELIVYAGAMESEAADRYHELADQMEVHNNPEVAELFRKLAGLSEQLKDHYMTSAKGMEPPNVAPWDYHFECIESLRADNTDAVHYLMTPYHVIDLALCCKRRLVKFFALLSDTHDDDRVRRKAQDFQQEQTKHLRLLEQWLSEHPEPDEDWCEDHDPPTLQE